jgi:hypothetical protein
MRFSAVSTRTASSITNSAAFSSNSSVVSTISMSIEFVPSNEAVARSGASVNA